LKNAIANPVTGPDGNAVHGWYVAFLEHFALPNIGLFNFIVPVGELLIGIGLILGCLTTAAAFFALIMNFSFMFAGTVSSNPIDIFYGFMIIMAGANAGKFGLDRWVMPYLTTLTGKRKSTEGKTLKSA
jgi:thiosulfate dehydrogenase [quinone] large subunit